MKLKKNILAFLVIFFLNIFGVIFFIKGADIFGALLIFLGQFFFAINKIYKCDKGLYFQDIRLLFINFYLLYGSFLPVYLISSSSNGLGIYLPESDTGYTGIVSAVLLYALGLFGLNVALIVQPIAWVSGKLPVSKKINAIPGLILLLLSVIATIAYAAANGTTFSFSIDIGNRGNMFDQIWVVLIFILSGIFMYLIAHYSHLSTFSKVNLYFYSAIFLMFMLMIGDRRDFLPILIFILAVRATHLNLMLGLKQILWLFLIFIGFLSVGYLRNLSNISEINPLIEILKSNEFIFPIQTLIYYVNSDVWSLHFGESYLRAPMYFIPRALWDGKPISLGMEFLIDYVGTTNWQGYAYTPITEAYVNFFWYGPPIVMFFLGLLMNRIVANWQKYSAIYFICLAYVLDFNRGEFGTHLYGLVFVWCGYKLTWLVCRPIGNQAMALYSK